MDCYNVTLLFAYIRIDFLMGGTVVQWEALLPQSKKVPGFKPGFTQVFSGVYMCLHGFSPASPTVQVRLIGDSKKSL